MMTYNEAVVEARENASKTSKSWYIFSDGQENYHIGDNARQIPSTAISNGYHELRVTAVVNPVWQE
ncbi:MAG: hypothetical protein HQL70_05345 [Magnetococcales bacterium]|nr:hypothetical protein [Magnetococcales bacterium]